MLSAALTIATLSCQSAAASDWPASKPAIPDCFDQLNAESGVIQRITDGDTVVLQDDRRVRLIGINTLELNAPDRQFRQAAQRAREALQKLLPVNEPVLLFTGTESHDRHNRVLAHVVRLSDKLSPAATLLKQGHAVQTAVAPNTHCADYYSSLEKQAREQQLGVWQLTNLATSAVTINKKSRGFKLVTGTVTNVQTHPRHTQIMLDNKLSVKVRKKLATKPGIEKLLPELIGSKVEVRGWLSQRKNRQQLWMQYPTNFQVLAN